MAVPVIEAKRLSKYYGSVLGVSEIDWSVDKGIIGLLGPNGAGKSTFLKMVVGLMRPSRGTLRVFGEDPFANAAVRSRIAYCPEHEQVYPELSALEFVTAMARLSGVANARQAAEEALITMGLKDAMKRKVVQFSKGMRQRTKIATSLVHKPELVVLDEPLTGIDPLERRRIVEHIQKLPDQGTSVLVSSHVLYEVEAITQEIMVIYRGQVLAEGNLRAIRKLIDKHPHRIRVECEQPRGLGAKLAEADHVLQMHFDESSVTFETADPDRCYDLISDVCLRENIGIRSMSSPDNNLGSVFDYLTGDRR